MSSSGGSPLHRLRAAPSTVVAEPVRIRNPPTEEPPTTPMPSLQDLVDPPRRTTRQPKPTQNDAFVYY
eukprot:m.52214 g.52214  ORF g.52214 m.52214 type:complete len:68 (-) comp48418_c0_seq1:114-317(-)